MTNDQLRSSGESVIVIVVVVVTSHLVIIMMTFCLRLSSVDLFVLLWPLFVVLLCLCCLYGCRGFAGSRTSDCWKRFSLASVSSAVSSAIICMPSRNNYFNFCRIKLVWSILQRCFLIILSFVRPPGTTVPDGLMFYPWCFLFFATLSPRSLHRSPWNFATWSESDCVL